ncbi:hypothetical protein GCM10010413_02890 [Promicromonospora sukumoe]
MPSTFHWPFGRAGRFDVVGVRRAGVRVSGGVGAVFTMCGVLFVRGARAWNVLGEWCATYGHRRPFPGDDQGLSAAGRRRALTLRVRGARQG